MNTPNLAHGANAPSSAKQTVEAIASVQEQQQRIVNDAKACAFQSSSTICADALPAVEAKCDRQTDLYIQGRSDAAFHVDPKYPQIEAYWQGYSEHLRRDAIFRVENAKKISPQGHQKQGYLLESDWSISKHFGKLQPIGSNKDYQGWEIELNGLEIEIYTLDWEDARNETKWAIASIHPDCLKFLADLFGAEAVRTVEEMDVFAS